METSYSLLNNNNNNTYNFLTHSMEQSPSEQLTGLQLVKKFPAFHGTPRFITALTSARHLYLSWASQIQSIYPRPTSCRSILILSTYLRLGLLSGLFPSGRYILENRIRRFGNFLSLYHPKKRSRKFRRLAQSSSFKTGSRTC